jgi:delta-aminolevulinic acid dehydratase/porphobilinogen synthase
MNFPDYRGRRVRRTEGLRRMIRETRLSVDDFVYPLFVVPGSGIEKPISSLPGQFNLSVDKAVDMAVAPSISASRACSCSASPSTRTRSAARRGRTRA